MARDKKYFPQRYATDQYFHVSPHHDFIQAEPSFAGKNSA